jgi:hypothetical protein
MAKRTTLIAGRWRRDLSRVSVRLVSGFQWTPKRETAAVKFAEGCNAREVAQLVAVTDRTLRRWVADEEFSTEVDRLSLMIGIASRAERLRIANRVIREKIRGELIDTQKDILEWIKFAQSETDGINLNLAQALAEAEASMAGSGQARPDRETEAA